MNCFNTLKSNSNIPHVVCGDGDRIPKGLIALEHLKALIESIPVFANKGLRIARHKDRVDIKQCDIDDIATIIRATVFTKRMFSEHHEVVSHAAFEHRRQFLRQLRRSHVIHLQQRLGQELVNIAF